MPRVLSLQSLVAHGHVGNRVAVFVLERLGIDVVAVPTAILSNHTGYPSAARASFGAADTTRLIHGLEEIGALKALDAVLVGYTGSAGAVGAAARAIDVVRESEPGIHVVIDPAMGDEGCGMFVPDEVASAVAELLVPRATILVPNRYELGVLASRLRGSPGRLRGGAASVLGISDAIRGAGPRSIVVSNAGDDPAEVVVIVVEERAHVLWTPRLPTAVGGAGDLLAAVLTAALVRGATVIEAARRAVDATAAVLAETVSSGGAELRLVAAQGLLADPPRASRVTTLR